ncbi:hypothetical protein ACFW16_32590 [Inquilinus sp. NPDC058860]|uniref:hypothetical protein n=1 Tax=Inquilinus sp. NPDC058860 TaxID=3346652 RepID=UPI0036B0A2DB
MVTHALKKGASVTKVHITERADGYSLTLGLSDRDGDFVILTYLKSLKLYRSMDAAIGRCRNKYRYAGEISLSTTRR